MCDVELSTCGETIVTPASSVPSDHNCCNKMSLICAFPTNFCIHAMSR